MPSIGDVSFEYSANGDMKPDTCDDFLICNRILKPGTPKRKLIDLITRFSIIRHSQIIQSSNQHLALCWWLDDLDRNPHDGLQNIALVQRHTLALLFFNTPGLHWHNKNKWLLDDSECNWFGVSCELSGIVITINLSSNNMIGCLPPELGEFNGLEYLILDHNRITGIFK